MGRLDQKVAVITGAARGIGQEMALTFAEEGADIVIADLQDMETTVKGVQERGRRALAVKADVTKKSEVDGLFDAAVASFGKVDILVNNAGIIRLAPLPEMAEEDWDAVINVNLKGVFLCTQAAGKHMVRQRYGKVVNIASITGMIAIESATTAYGTSKAAVAQLTRICATELGPHGINVNAIAPGFIMTDFSREASPPEFLQAMAEKTIFKRMGTPREIANVALFLASDESSFITGEVIVADGGRLALG